MPYTPEKIFQSLLEINNILVREVTRDGLFQRLASYLQENFGCDRVSLTIYQPETNSLSWFASAEGIGITQMDIGHEPERGPLARMAIESQKPVIVPSLELYNNYKAIRCMIEAGLNSSMAFPLISRGKSIGAVVVSFKNTLGSDSEPLSELLKQMSLQIALAVDNMLIYAKLNDHNQYLSEQVDSLVKLNDPVSITSRFFYQCPTMQNIMKQLLILAKSDVPVLISGETGTGKEFIAQFIHSHSSRAKYNFVKVSCPALSPTLFESELFGHAKGAFTGAATNRIGRFELADKGSIFLDEIGELDIILQAKLLHVLQDSKFERVGENTSRTVDIRCIAATNADLHSMIHSGEFRRDLFYRLGVTSIHIPPLREREGELIPMIRHLVQIYSKEMGKKPFKLHKNTVDLLNSYTWPGNVRELSNLVARLLILHADEVVVPEHVYPLFETSGAAKNTALPTGLPLVVDKISSPAVYPGKQSSCSLAEREKQHIEATLEQTYGRVSGPHGAARLLNIPRSTLQYKIKKHNISPKKYAGQCQCKTDTLI